MSPSLVSQVETGKTQPSVSTLYTLATYLGMSFDDLLKETGPPIATTPELAETGAAPAAAFGTNGIVQRRSHNPVLEMENGVRWERLARSRVGDVDPLLVTYEPGASSSIEGRMMRHSGVEYAYLLSGRLTARLEFDTVVLNPGDSLSFDSVRPHMYSNEDTVPATGLWFVVGRRDFSQEMPSAGADAPAQSGFHSAVDMLQAMDGLH